jgi:hypothetical protein
MDKALHELIADVGQDKDKILRTLIWYKELQIWFSYCYMACIFHTFRHPGNFDGGFRFELQKATNHPKWMMFCMPAASTKTNPYEFQDDTKALHSGPASSWSWGTKAQGCWMVNISRDCLESDEVGPWFSEDDGSRATITIRLQPGATAMGRQTCIASRRTLLKVRNAFLQDRSCPVYFCKTCMVTTGISCCL